jgi:uncharacterized protein
MSVINEFLAQPAIALVGASRSRGKFGNYALRVMRDKGYRVYPIHPSAKTIDGVECYPRIEDTPEHVDAVLIAVPPVQAIQVIREAAAAGVRYIWLQQGAESIAAITVATQLGLEVVGGECILMFAKPTGIHKAHRFILRMIGRLAA